MIEGIHHISLVVRSLAAAQRFYCAAAGMRPVAQTGAATIVAVDRRLVAPQPFEHRLLAGRNGYLRLIAPHELAGAPDSGANPINRAGFRHFCVQNREIAVLSDPVTAHGGMLIAQPLDLGTGNQYAYARDPEGNVMEIEGLPYAPANVPTWLGHVALVTRDMDRALAFYAPLLGAATDSRGCFGPGPQFDRMSGLDGARIEGAWLPAGNLQLELWQFHAPPSPLEPAPRHAIDPGYGHLCLESDDLDADAAHMVALGGSLLGDILENERARAIFASDPEGNILELLELRGAGRLLSIAALAEPGIRARVEAGRLPHHTGANA